jgi:adenylate cyclase
MAMNLLGPILSANQLDTHTQEAIQRADEFVTQSIAADPNLYLIYEMKAWVLILQKRPEEAIIAAKRGLALNPSYVGAYFPMCVATGALGHPERSVELADKAIRLSPRDPLLPAFYWQKAYHYFMAQQDVQAIEWMRRMLAVDNKWPIPKLYLAALLALNGKETEARETIKNYLSLKDIEIRSIRALETWLYLWSDSLER